ncbi:hypothetical protein IAS59_006632 [Cryptococcus gattii]
MEQSFSLFRPLHKQYTVVKVRSTFVSHKPRLWTAHIKDLGSLSNSVFALSGRAPTRTGSSFDSPFFWHLHL